MFVHKNIKKIQEHAKGFEIKLITTIISGLFLSQAAVAHEYFPNNINYRDVQQTNRKDIVLTGQHFDQTVDYPNGMIVDSFTASANDTAIPCCNC